MKCPKCGADVKEGSKVCLNCGYYLNSEDNENNEDDTFDDSFDEYVEEKENNFDDFDDSQDEDTEKSGFNFKKNIIYIILGFILIIALIILIIGLNKSKKTTPTPTSTPEVKTSKKVSVDNYKITVPAGLEYRIGNNIINISDDEAYSFSFKISDGDFNLYSSNMEEIKSSLNNSGYNITSFEKKTVSEKEFLIFTLSLGSDVSYLYITEYSSNRVCMGVINVHNKSSVNGVLEVVLKILNTVDMNDSSSDGSSNTGDSVEDSSGINNISTSLVDDIKSVLN